MKYYKRIHAANYLPDERIKKHKIGKRERILLEDELAKLLQELKALDEKDNEGFILFYYNAKANGKKVQRREEIEGILRKGFYYKIIN